MMFLEDQTPTLDGLIVPRFSTAGVPMVPCFSRDFIYFLSEIWVTY